MKTTQDYKEAIIRILASRCVLEECLPEKLALPRDVAIEVAEVYQQRLQRGVKFAIQASLEDLRVKNHAA